MFFYLSDKLIHFIYLLQEPDILQIELSSGLLQ